MPLDTSSRIPPASIGEKVAKLSAFIADDLDGRTARALQAAGGCYLVIARSPGSPVAQALRLHAARLAATGIRVRTIFSEVEPANAVLAAPFAAPGECRIVRDSRLLAAHEQLVLSPNAAWTGDCMRRDPAKRDTYELFSPNSVEISGLAARSFERLWRSAVPVESMPALPPSIASVLNELAGIAPLRPEVPRRQ
jgi:hypothetical protein